MITDYTNGPQCEMWEATDLSQHLCRHQSCSDALLYWMEWNIFPLLDGDVKTRVEMLWK